MTQARSIQLFPPADGDTVTKLNFTIPPYNRWALKHMRYLNNTAPIERGKLGVSLLETAPLELLKKTYVIAKNTQTLIDFAEQSYTDSFLVLHNGKIITEYYANGMEETTPHWTASVTKSFTGVLAELMIYRGLLDPNKKIESYIPELKDSPYGFATVRQVLDMSVGVASDGNYEDLYKNDSYLNKFSRATGFLPNPNLMCCYDVLQQAKPTGKNGDKFCYASPTAEVAGWLISKVSNDPLEVLLSKEIWSKLGTDGEAYTLIDPKFKMLSTGGLNLSTRDLARFGQMIANKGKFNGRQILPSAVIEKILSPGDKKVWAKGDFADIPYITSYQSYWYQTNNEYSTIMGFGIYGQHLYIDPVNNVVIVKFGSYPTQINDFFDNGWLEVYTQIINNLKK